MIAALLARNHVVEIRGERITLRRPRVADLIGLIDAQGRGENLMVFYILNHVIDSEGRQVFTDAEQVKSLDALAAQELAKEIDRLYTEGQD